MKAFLLSAGYGTRLKPLTNNIPKCLVPICGKPLLAWWMDLFEKHGINEVLINTHYLADEVREFIEYYNAQKTGVTLIEAYGDDYETKDGSCVRDYVHVEDLAVAHYLGLKYIMEHNVTEQFNLGSNDGFTVLEIIKKFEEISGMKVPYDIIGRRLGDPAVLVTSNKKAKDLLGWKLDNSSIEYILKTALAWEKNKRY